MSRLIIKNLPPYVTPARLREHFEQKGCPGGTLTDVKVSFKEDGTSRRFGFIGYKSDQEAAAAQKWFDRTFIDSTRINVTITEGSKDAPAPRPHKRRRLDIPASDPSPLPTKVETKPKGDRKLEKYMDIMKPKKGPSWANEAQVEPPPVPSATEPQEEEVVKDDRVLTDLEWMRQRMSKNVDIVEPAFEQSDDEDEEISKVTEVQESKDIQPPEPKKDAIIETILQTSRLFVRNLAFSCTNEELNELFTPFGEIKQIHSPLDATTKQRKGLSYVTFVNPKDAVSAYEALDKKSFQGRLLHIIPAVDRKGYEVVEAEGKKTLKEEKNAKRKALAGKEFNWSMLYMNSDAVASSIASRMNIDKSEILNPESGDNAAVRLALAETHIIQETKTYLESQGVLLSSFSSRARSSTTILVKNIPFGTSEEQIRELFEPHGEVSRILVPPAGTMAVVEYENPDDAAKGFRSVAYRRLGNSIIYLEKGPLGMFGESSAPTKSTTSGTVYASARAVRIPEQIVDGPEETEQEPSVQGGSTLYVKNLSFSTTQDRLSKVFSHLPSFSFARIQTKPDPLRPGGRLSMGYGFIGFKDVESARKALKSLQGFVLDGHSLHVSFAGRGVDHEQSVDANQTSTSRTAKIIVKNVPFEATKKDIRELFGSHGQLKSARLPKKFDSRSRGFAFLEFISRHEAENAYEALKHTHLLGRHLVLEWAEDAEQDLEVLRKKAGVGFGAGKEMPGRKRKLNFNKNAEDDVEDLEK